jgi:hypothetical protein
MGFEAEASTSAAPLVRNTNLTSLSESDSPDTDGPKPPENKRPKLSIVK